MVFIYLLVLLPFITGRKIGVVS